jgi:hypothetical protein
MSTTKEVQVGIKDLLTEGCVVQIKPSNEEGGVDGFGGCFMVVTQANARSPYVMGYVAQPGRPDVPIYTRVRWTQVAFTGFATWVNEARLTGKLKDLADEAKRKQAAEAQISQKARKQASRK